ncbi:impB/mucB/samB family protein [Candida albicans]|uniref:DNA repair protein REV1 n=1 Tax=Candida albicans TaxID=5476 RepID=A0A8H6F6R3_CANAX|nr:impB/mucB/samB family protein [Candida albicans]
MDNDQENANSEEYPSFLRSLDDESFITHIQDLNKQHSQKNRQDYPFEHVSTPKKMASFNSAISSDPFDDGLDEEIINHVNKIDDKKALSGDEDDNNKETVGKLHEFGDYATYFHSKRLKQQKQDEEYVKWDKKRRKLQNVEYEPKQIFKGCSIFVNGHTNPSITEIHRLVILHGGQFVSYMVNKSSVTHIVCDRLTPRKSIQFKNCRVVKAQWIVDSVAQQTLLDWTLYRSISEVAYDQRRLDFAKQSTIEESKEINGECENNKEEGLDGEINSSLFGEDNADFLDKSQELETFFEKREGLVQEPEEDLPVVTDEPPQSGKGIHKVNNKIVKERLHQPASHFQNPFIDPGEKKVIMHIDFDCFFATASCLKRPDLDSSKHPIAVSHGGKTSDIASCNYVARKYGVKNGMWLMQATKLCPDLILLPYEFESYEKFSSEFYNYLLTSKFFDSIFPVSIDEVLVDATSYCHSGVSDSVSLVNELATRIRKDVFKLTNCPVSVGASTNVLLAKLALRKAKPNGQFYLFDDIEKFLESIYIKDLPGFGRGILEKLNSEIQSSNPQIKDVVTISKQRLVQLLGEKTGTKLFEYARGMDETSIEIDTNNPEAVLGRKSVSVDVNFGIRFDTVEELDDFLMRLSRELYQRLVSLGICGSSLTLKLAKRAEGASINPPKFLGMGRCDFVNKSSKLGVPTNDWGIIGNEVKVLYRMVNIPVKELRGISITISKLVDAEGVKSNKQMRLPFKKAESNALSVRDLKQLQKMSDSKDNKSQKLIFSKQSPEKRHVNKVLISHEFADFKSLDWEVFHVLPDEIKSELKVELRRRGMLSEKSTPTKGKTYLQQLKSRSETSSPIKVTKQEPVYEESQSYDTSVLNELPSSIKESVIRDVEYKEKIKKFDLVSMRDKLAQKLENKKVPVNEVTSDWIKSQEKLNKTPLFLNEQLKDNELSVKLDDWVKSSLLQGGPHEEDMDYFALFVQTMLQRDQFNRVLLLLRRLKERLKYHKTLINCQVFNEEEYLVYEESFEDWYKQLDNKVQPLVDCYSKKKKIQVGYIGVV